MKQRYQTYRSYIRKRFGKPVLKVPVNAGFSCPNRDGTISSLGCAFCDNRAFSPVAETDGSPVDQLNRVIERTSGRFQLFIAYLQPFTNTYGSVEMLRQQYEPLIAHEKVVGLAVGTRPDCLDNAIYDYLSEMSGRTYLSVELGLQSADNKILKRINRGHTFEQFETACNELAKRNIETVAHMMIGLPGDNDNSIKQSACKLACSPVQGIKIHQLMIVKGTQFEKEYCEGKIDALTIERYSELLGLFLSYLRTDQYIHRIMADSTSEKGLIAPDWSSTKTKSLACITKYLADNDIIQGKYYTF